jgi:hypothetical protein
MKKLVLPISVLVCAACRPNVLITVEANSAAVEDGLKRGERFELNLFLYSQADNGLNNESKTVGLDKTSRFSLSSGTLDLHAISVDPSHPPESCDPSCDGYWEGETINLVVPTNGHIEEVVTISAVCDC